MDRLTYVLLSCSTVNWVDSESAQQTGVDFEVQIRNPPQRQHLSSVLMACFPFPDYGTFLTRRAMSIPAVGLREPD